MIENRLDYNQIIDGIDAATGLPVWGNRFLSPLEEYFLAGSTVEVGGALVSKAVCEGKTLPGMKDVRYVAEGGRSEVARAVRNAKRFLHASSIFDDNGLDKLISEGKKPYVDLAESDPNGTWRIVVLDINEKPTTSRKDYNRLKLYPALSRSFELTAEKGSLNLRYLPEDEI